MKRHARGTDYFAASDYPVTAVRVQIDAESRLSHPHDLTEVEHDHDFRELVIVLRGRALHRLQGRNYPVRAGDVYILNEHSRHCFREIEELETINVMYDDARLPLPHDQLLRMPGYSALFLFEPKRRQRRRFSSRLHLKPPALARARAIGEEMMREASSGAPGRGAMLLARLLELIVFLSRQYGASASSGGRELLRIGSLIREMEQDYARRWTLGEMCAMARMSRSTFERTFRRAMGLSPMAFLMERRLDAAARLLKDTDLTVTEIAMATGFSDGNYFTRQFRRSRGLPPTAYRL